jgi:hypothetical protein
MKLSEPERFAQDLVDEAFSHVRRKFSLSQQVAGHENNRYKRGCGKGWRIVAASLLSVGKEDRLGNFHDLLRRDRPF